MTDETAGPWTTLYDLPGRRVLFVAGPRPGEHHHSPLTVDAGLSTGNCSVYRDGDGRIVLIEARLDETGVPIELPAGFNPRLMASPAVGPGISSRSILRFDAASPLLGAKSGADLFERSRPGRTTGGDRHEERTVVCAFALGLNNFAAGRASMGELAEAISRELSEDGRLIAWHGASGNLLVETTRRGRIGEALRRATGRDWAVTSAGAVAAALAALPPVEEHDGLRLTPGLAFEVGGARIVAVTKRDVLDGTKLDKHRREGGWGAVSAAVARQHGGRWTARSWRPLDGLLRKL